MHVPCTSCTEYDQTKPSVTANVAYADRLLSCAQTSNLTVLRVFGTGADTSFQLTLQPGTAGADGKTWPNGGLMFQPRKRRTPAAALMRPSFRLCFALHNVVPILVSRRCCCWPSHTAGCQKLPSSIGVAANGSMELISFEIDNAAFACHAGVYNWNFVFGIEQIVEWCRAHGVKVMFTFLDNWSPVDSKTAVRSFCALAGFLMTC